MHSYILTLMTTESIVPKVLLAFKVSCNYKECSRKLSLPETHLRIGRGQHSTLSAAGMFGAEKAVLDSLEEFIELYLSMIDFNCPFT